ncbi:MAG TPA: MBL fold metallo-hydrolase [Polyangiales bacterium]
MSSRDSITVTRSQHGPFERLSFVASSGRDKPFQVSVYRIGDTLIDTGGTRVAHALVDALRDDPPRRVVCTHQHEDHVGGIGALRRSFGALPVHIASAYVPLLADFDRVPVYRGLAWGQPEPVPDLISFEPGWEFEAGGLRLRALETPGHTPFHISFVAEASACIWALTGDLYTTSPLTAWFEAAADDGARSCRTLAALGPTLQVLPTHGRVRENGAEALLGLAEALDQGAASVRRHAERHATRDPFAIARALFGEADAPFSHLSEYEFCHANFVRSVLEPVRSLPAARLTP